MTTIDTLFELAIELRDDGDMKNSIGVLSTMLDKYSNYERVDIIYTTLGGIYLDLKKHKKASANFIKATVLNPKSELASLGLYVSYVKLKSSEKAIKELIRYLEIYPAKLYIVTLEELLEGLAKGYMANYKKEILELAKINKVRT